MIKGNFSGIALDETDFKLLRYLQKNGRFNIKELADTLNISKTPIYERIKRLEQEGYIKEYVALIDRKKVGVPLMVFCAVSLNIQNAENIVLFTNEIKKIKEIIECHSTGGVLDFLLKVIVADLDAYNDFVTNKLATIPNVGKIQSSFALSEIKSSTAIPF
jgi:Lrp/AsnC family transcriptional regulator